MISHPTILSIFQQTYHTPHSILHSPFLPDPIILSSSTPMAITMKPWSCGKRNEHWAHGGQPDASSWLSAEFADHWYNAKQRLGYWFTAWFLWPKFCRLGTIIWVNPEWLSHTFSFSLLPSFKNPWILAIYDFPNFSGHGKRKESWLDKYANLSAVSCKLCPWHPRHCIFLC